MSEQDTSLLPIVSDNRKRILVLLKKEGPQSLAEVARKIELSKMGAYKHITNLEERGLVQRLYQAGKVGRPRLLIRLTEKSQAVFPRAYVDISLAALSFVEEKLGRGAVEEILLKRQKELFSRYLESLEGKQGPERVRELARLRDQDGYMAEAHESQSGTFEILEHNCPILGIASKFQEACSVETRLFANLLRTSVETSHRAAVGDSVCRFLIKRRLPKAW